MIKGREQTTRVIEKVGSGTRDMLDKCRTAGTPAPEWIEEDDGFTVVLRKVTTASGTNAAANDRVIEKVTEKVTAKVTENQRAITELLSVDPSLTQAKLSEEIGISRRHIASNIRRLVNMGRLRRVGPDKGGHWEVVS